jgi:erythrocyte band 7 integral membrane protein
MAGKDDERIVVGTVENEDSGCGACVEGFLWVLSMLLIICTFPLSLFVTMKQVQEYERAVIFRLGKVKKGGAVGPGLFFIIPCLDSIQTVDLRTITFDVPPQEILTKDSVTVAVDAVVYFKIFNPMNSVINVQNANQATRLLASTTLRNMLGTKNLHDILADREEIARTMLAQLDHATDSWGIRVERVEVKDVRLPQQLQRAMAAEAEASRQARAKVIEAEGEQKASRALKEASDIISSSSSALQLRYLQTLSQIAAERNSTIVFPLPIELMGQLMPKNGQATSM